MSNRPLMAGAPTVEINISRYDELLQAEVKWLQYMTAVKKFNPELAEVIESSTDADDVKTETERNE